MLYLTICDDETAQLSLLESYVGEWARERRYETEITLCRSAEEFLFRREEKREMDILLLDIDMPGMNGLSLARRLRGAGEETQIIFVTGLSDYALEGYEVEAVGEKGAAFRLPGQGPGQVRQGRAGPSAGDAGRGGAGET